jgi:hypothetical protein
MVQSRPSEHGKPSGFLGSEQPPSLGLHVPAVWHWSDAAQVTGFEPTQLPAWQVSVCVHALPSLQAAPLLRLRNAVVETAGWQLWHAFSGFTVPEA